MMASPQVSLPPLAAADGPADASKDSGSPPGSPTAIDAPSAGLAWADPDIYGRGYDGLFGERAERKTARAAARKLHRHARARAAAADPAAAAAAVAEVAAAAAAAAAAATDGSPGAVVAALRLPKRREHVDHDLYGRGDPRLFGVDAHLETAAVAGAALSAAQDAKAADAVTAARSPTAGAAAAATATVGGTAVAVSPLALPAGSPRSRLFFRSASPALLGKAKARIKAKMSARPLPRGAGGGKAPAGSWRTAVPGGISRSSSDAVPAHGLGRINASVANAARSPAAAGVTGLAGGGSGATTAPMLTPGSAVAGLAARWEQGAAAREADDLPSVTAKDVGAGVGGVAGVGAAAASTRGRRPGAFSGAAAGSAAGGGWHWPPGRQRRAPR